MKIRSLNDKLFDGVNTLLLILVLAIVLLPLIFVLAASVSDPDAVLKGQVWFWPVGFNFEAYNMVLKHQSILTGYKNTILYTAVGTVVNIILTTFAAYPLSRKDFYGRNVFMMLMVFTMYFGGGMIPAYLNIRALGLINSFWVMIFPGAVSTMNVIIMRTFFQSTIPGELIEAAIIDGSSNLHALIRIILPLSVPVISVLVLYYAVGHWNAYFNALIYLQDASKYPLQLILREVLVLGRPLSLEGLTQSDMITYADQLKRSEMLKYAIIIVANLPVLMIYPLIQKYFVKGVMIGSVKG